MTFLAVIAREFSKSTTGGGRGREDGGTLHRQEFYNGALQDTAESPPAWHDAGGEKKNAVKDSGSLH